MDGDRAELIQQFKSIAACSDETAQEVLAQSNWNLQVRVIGSFERLWPDVQGHRQQ